MNPQEEDIVSKTISKLSIDQALAFYDFAVKSLPKPNCRGRISYRIFESAFGRAQRKLRRISNIIFSRRNDYQVGKKNASYIISSKDIQALKAKAGLTKSAAETIQAKVKVSLDETYRGVFNKHSAELQTGQFNYTQKGNRRYHPLQNIPSKVRSALFIEYGYTHEYDVTSAIVSLTYRKYLLLGGRSNKLIQAYLDDTKGFRVNLAKQLDISEATAKLAINTAIHVRAISSSAGFGKQSSLMNTLGSKFKVVQFRALFGPLHKALNRVLNALREDTKQVLFARKFFPNSALAKSKLKPLTATLKHDIYAKVELEFQREIESNLDVGNKVMFIHDGWYSTKPVNVPVKHTHKTEFKLDLMTLVKWVRLASCALNKSIGTFNLVLKQTKVGDIHPHPYINTPKSESLRFITPAPEPNQLE